MHKLLNIVNKQLHHLIAVGSVHNLTVHTLTVRVVDVCVELFIYFLFEVIEHGFTDALFGRS